LSARRSRAQGYVEFGLVIAVVALMAMVGAEQLRGAVYMYFTGTGMSDSLDPTMSIPSTGLPSNITATDILCNGLPSTGGTADTNFKYYDCVARVRDTGDPNWRPTGGTLGQVTIATSAAGSSDGTGWIVVGASSAHSLDCDMVPNTTPTVPPSTLAPGPGSRCSFKYWAENSGRPDRCPSGCPTYSATYEMNTHKITATYSPPSPPVITGSTANTAFFVKRVAGVVMRERTSPPPPTPLWCSKETVRVGETVTCTAHVKDVDTTPRPDAFTGFVNWKVCNPLGSACSTAGLSATSCTVVPFNPPDESQCSMYVDFTPALSDIGIRSFDLSYSGDPLHSPWVMLNGRENITVVPADTTTTRITGCSPSGPLTISPPTSTTCTIQVTNTGVSGLHPNGQVTFVVSGGGTGIFTTGCTTLNSTATPGVSECAVSYTPTSGAVTHTIKAVFAAQNGYAGSDSDGTSSSQNITVNP
jgi:hypothetical protein